MGKAPDAQEGPERVGHRREWHGMVREAMGGSDLELRVHSRAGIGRGDKGKVIAFRDHYVGKKEAFRARRHGKS